MTIASKKYVDTKNNLGDFITCNTDHVKVTDGKTLSCTGLSNIRAINNTGTDLVTSHFEISGLLFDVTKDYTTITNDQINLQDIENEECLNLGAPTPVGVDQYFKIKFEDSTGEIVLVDVRLDTVENNTLFEFKYPPWFKYDDTDGYLCNRGRVNDARLIFLSTNEYIEKINQLENKIRLLKIKKNIK